MNETSKCHELRERRGDFDRFLRGEGVDIGAGSDPLRIKRGRVRTWDKSDGDAMCLQGTCDGAMDFAYSSHCLEHLRDVEYALINWVRILKPGGILYVVVPDFELYEKCSWPSRFNSDHKATFSLRINRQQAGGRHSHYHILEDLAPFLRRYGVHLVQIGLEDYGYDHSASPECDQTLGPATAQICFVGRKVARNGTALFVRNELGAGDHANLLPVFRYLHNVGYDVVGHRAYSLYDHLPVKEPPVADAIEVPVYFKVEENLPATQLRDDLRERLGLDLSGIVFPGICLSAEELHRVRRLRERPYVNFFPYTTIRQKIVSPQVVGPLIRRLEARGWPIFTTRLTDDEAYPWSELFHHFHPTHPGHFDRQWILEVAGAALNVCCDGGPLNVSLACGTPTLGLLTIADASLMSFYPAWQWRAVSSNYPCAPCFRAADYGSKRVFGCDNLEDYCGRHFPEEEAFQAIDELLAGTQPLSI